MANQDTKTLLVVDDEENILLMMEDLLSDKYEILTATDGDKALDIINAKGFSLDLVITDLMMPNIDGLSLLREIKANFPELGVMMMSAHGTISSAIEAMHAGAYDYITKPLPEFDELDLKIQRYFEKLELITKRVQAEKALQQARDKLEGSNQELIRVNRSKSELLSIVSHELRTPLTSIDGFARLIYERFLTDDLIAKCNDATRPTIERVKNRIGIVRENTARLGRLINDFLDFSRIERGRELEMDFIHVDLSDIIKLTVETYQGLVAEKGLTLSYSGEVALNCEPFTVLGDVDRLRQVLSNLVNNAIKFTPRGGQIIIGTHFVDEQIQLTIRDTGVGIPKDKLETILEPFEQSGSTASRKGGTGLGLAIVKHIIDHHNGTIRVESEEGVGTTIIIMFCEYSQGLHLKLKQSRESKPEAEREGSAVGLK